MYATEVAFRAEKLLQWNQIDDKSYCGVICDRVSMEKWGEDVS